LIFASTDKNKKTPEDYTKNVSEYLEKAKSAYDKYTDHNCIDNTTREKSLDKAVEIAEQFLEERKKIAYLFTWDKVPGDGEKELKQFLKNDFEVGWAEHADISKSYDDKTIYIYKDENHEDKNSAKIMIVEANKTAILAISDGKTHELKEYELKVKWEDGKLNIHNRAKDWEKEVEWTAPKAATEVVLREWWFKLAYGVFIAVFSAILILPSLFFSYCQLQNQKLFLPWEAISQLLLTAKIFLLFGFKALFAYIFLSILNCWTASWIVIPWIYIVVGIIIVGLVVSLFLFSYWLGEKKPLPRRWTGGVKIVSFLENLPGCWDEIIEQHNEEKEMRKNDETEEKIYTKVKEEIKKCINSYRKEKKRKHV
jgi:hypothetical protein